MTKDQITKWGREVLYIESQAVNDMADRLDQHFADAVEILSQTKARVIITGIGKSGLVGRKIAATLSSCGTPALFVHPVEAGHGDLGMIVAKDVMLAISYSGNTREIVPILDFVKRIGIKLISITGNPQSMLAKYSDVVLDARVKKEAEPSGVIPTASSTAALAIGDALAIALMKKKGFSEQDFSYFHPRGQAGKKLIRIKSLMHKGQQIPSVSPAASIQLVLHEISQKQFGMTCVTDKKGTLLGIITDGDLRRKLEQFGQNLLNKTARDCMTVDPLVIDKDALATEALNVMEERRVTALVVKNKRNQVEGIIHLHDLWRTEMF
jgi:arabinose-5-phosphate isomerase